MAPPQLIHLKSEDGIILSVDAEVAKMSLVLRDMVAFCDEAEDGDVEPPIPVNVTANILKMVLEWCEHNHREEETTDNKDKEARQLEKWGHVLHAITRAANCLNIEALLDICLNAMANQIKGKSSLEIRDVFGLPAAVARGKEDDGLSIDSVHFHQIFPEEVWTLVTNNLLKTSPGDLENLSNSSPYFRNLLLAKRTTFLFEKAFSIVAPAIWKKEGLEGLPVSDVLQLRAVCSDWNTAVDKLIPQKFKHFGEETSEDEAQRIGLKFRRISQPRFRHFDIPIFMRFGSISQFLRHFKSTHPANQPNGRNPFIWGTLDILIHYDNENGIENNRRHLNIISELLSKYGSHLHKLKINFGGGNALPHQLQAWLSCVPNLKELTMDCMMIATRGDDDMDEDENCQWKFPSLNHLDKLDLNWLPPSPFNQLLRQTTQLSSLTIQNSNDGTHKFFTFPLPNLKHLELECSKANYITNIRSPLVQWPLESLTLTLESFFEENVDDVEIAALLQVIQERFASTLVNLDLTMIYRNVGKECKNFRLDLPNLKKFKLQCSRIEKEAGLDFLLPMVNNLEEIELRYKKMTFEDEKAGITNGATTIQFHGFEDNLLDSNIWTIFKKMKRIQMILFGMGQDCKVYCREDWLQNKGADA